MWLKRFLVCSATLTGGCIYCWSRSFNTVCNSKNDKKTEDEDCPSYIYLPEHAGVDYDESMESSWIFWKKTNFPIYWKLLMLCNSKDHRVRIQAVESLSKIPSLDKWQYIVIAQACDVRTSIGLARSSTANSLFFLPPHFRDLKEGNLQSELFTFISSLPLSNLDSSIQSLTKQVTKSIKALLKNDFSLDLEIGDPFVIYHSQQKKKEIFVFDMLCLQAILSHSTIKTNRSIMVEKGLLKLLLKLFLYHQKDFDIHSLVAQILANVALDQKCVNSMYMSGWIGILASWSRSSDVSVSLPAAKALANMDDDDTSHPLYDDGVYVLHPTFRQRKKVTADVIFVHGLLGATFWTWRQCDTQRKMNEVQSVSESSDKEDAVSSCSLKNYTMCWPKDWLAVDMPSLRLISVDYKSCVSNWSSLCPPVKDKESIKKKSSVILNKLLLSNVGERPIFWIAHSMGGLIVKQILRESFESKDKAVQLLAQNTVGVIFYSVPHKGSDVANKLTSASRIFQPSSDIAQLHKGSPNLISLHEKFKEIVLRYNIPVMSFGETKKSHWGISSFVLVPSDSSDPGFGEFHTLPVDHLSTCKPVSSISDEYLKVLNFLRTNIPEIVPPKKNDSDEVFEISKVLSLIP